MRKTKIYHGRDLIGRFNCDGRNYTKWQLLKFRIVRTVKRVTAVSALIVTVGWVAVGAGYYVKNNMSPVTVWAEKITEVPIHETTPVMQRIMDCESGDRNSKGKPIAGTARQMINGQVIIKVNSNGSYDQGIAQINSIHNKDATKAGYNLSVEKDNIAYAKYLYETRGTEDWYSSKTCWSI